MLNVNKLKIKLIIIVCSVMVISCYEQTKYSVAEACFSIEVPIEKTDEFISLFEIFSNSHNLEADKSNPGALIYKNSMENMAISVEPQSGPYGTIVSLFRFDKNKNKNIADDLKNYINNEVSSQFNIKKCQNIKGFEMPQIWL